MSLPLVAAFTLIVLSARLVQALPVPFYSDPEYLIHTWESGEGLPENSATAMVQASNGYLWFGTFNGLVRFDGLLFTTFTPNNSALPSEGIVNLHCDRRGRLWISTYRGLVVQDGGTMRTLGKADGWTGDVVRTFVERANGDLLITAFDGHVLEFANGRLATLPPPPGESTQGYFGYAGGDDDWWLVQNRFIGRWTGQTWEEMISIPTPPPSERVTAARARDGALWLFLDKELRKYRGRTQVAGTPTPDIRGGIWSLYEDSLGNVWICTYDHGLYRISPDPPVRHWTAENGLAHDGVRFVFEDQERNLWIGTGGGGLQRFKAHRFRTFTAATGSAVRDVQSVWPATTNSMWLATYGHGLYRWSDDAPSPVLQPLPGNPAFLQSVFSDHTGRTWVGSFDGGIVVLDPRGSVRIDSERFGPGVLALFEDSQQRIWLGGTRRLSVYDTENLNLLQEIESVSGTRCFAEDNRGVIWLSNLEGVFRIEQKSVRSVPDQQGRPLRDIGCIKTDPDGTVWLGSRRSGLLCRRADAIFQIGPEQGLPGTAVHGIIEDGLGFFWMSSDRGVIRARRDDLLAVGQPGAPRVEAQLFDQTDGLPGTKFAADSQPTCARDSRGRLWFATHKGPAMIDPARLTLNARKPPVQIESLAYFVPNRKLPKGLGTEVRLAPPFQEPVMLPAGSRRIVIQYAALSFVAPEKVRYQVRLRGSDPTWRDAGVGRLAEFFELSPSPYRFDVRAANNDGLWSDSGASLAFVVQPFFWQAWWFRGSFIAGLTGLGCVTTWWRSRTRHRRQMLELEQTRQRQVELAHVGRVTTMGQLAATLAHELNQPLGAILSNAEAAEMLLQTEPPGLDEVRVILADIRRDDQRAAQVIQRMRQLLKRRQLELTSLAVNDLIEQTVSLVRADAKARGIALAIELEPGLPSVRGDWVHLQQVLLNLILNAMDAMSETPPEERRLLLQARRVPDALVEVSARDFGSGIRPERLAAVFEPFVTTKKEGLGMGLALSRTIVEAHGGRIWAENNSDRGATLRFTLAIA